MEPLRIEISGSNPGEWEIIHRTQLAVESVSKVKYNESKIEELITEISHASLDMMVGMEEQRHRLIRLGHGLANVVFPLKLQEIILKTGYPLD